MGDPQEYAMIDESRSHVKTSEKLLNVRLEGDDIEQHSATLDIEEGGRSFHDPSKICVVQPEQLKLHEPTTAVATLPLDTSAAVLLVEAADLELDVRSEVQIQA